jgi:multiple sugar transport system substrate-binding protein
MKKKAVFLFIWAISIFLAVPGVLFAGGGAFKKIVRLKCWSFFSGSDGESFKAMIAKFNRSHPGIRISLVSKPYTGYDFRLVSAIADGTAPDVAVIHQGSLARYVKDGSLCALEDTLRPFNDSLDDFINAPLEACRFEGSLYALPLDVYPLVMYYNTDLFSRAEIVKVPETYAELVQAARTIHNRTGVIGLAVDNAPSSASKAWTLTWLFISLLKQQGTDLLTQDNTHANFNNTAGEKALSVIIDMVEVSQVVPPKLDYDASVNAFLQGKAGIHINGVWVTRVFEKQHNLKFAIAPLPILLGRNAAWAGSHTLAVPVQQTTDSRKAEAAAVFILWMTEQGIQWAKTDYVPVRVSALQQSEFLAQPNRSAYFDIAASAVMSPHTPVWDKIYNTISDSLAAALVVNKRVRTILTDMEQKVNEIIAGY